MTKRELILAASFDLFLAHGFDGAGIEQILAKAEVSRGGLYYHFKDKADLYDKVLAHYFLASFQETDILAFGNLSWPQQQLALIDFFEALPAPANMISRHGMARYFSLFFDALSRVPNFTKAVRGYYTSLLSAMAQAVTASGLPDGAATARLFLTQLEGEIYLSSVFGTAPDFTALTLSISQTAKD